MLKALRRRWIFGLSLGVICAAIIGGTTWLAAPSSKYTVRALFRVSSDAPRVIFATSEGKIDLDTYQKTQVTMIKSRGILEKAMAQPEVEKLPAVRDRTGDRVEWLEKELRVDYTGEILRISLSGQAPDELTTLVNAVADVYQQEIIDKERDVRLKRYDELKKIYDEYQKRLDERRKSLRSAAELIGSNDKSVLAVKHQLVLERLSMAERELMEVQAELRRAQAEFAMQPSQPKPGPQQPAAVLPPVPSQVPASAVKRHLEQDQEMTRLNISVSTLQASVASIRRRVRNAIDPALTRVLGDLADARASLARREKHLRSELETRWREEVPASTTMAGASLVTADPEVLTTRIRMLRELEKVTSQVVQKLGDEARSFNRDSMGMETLQDEIAHADAASKKIGAEVEILSVELKAPSRVVPIERASIPRREDEKEQIKIAGLTSLGTFALVLIGVSWCEFHARRVDTVDDVVHGLGLKIVGTLPALPRRTRMSLRGPESGRDQRWRRLLIESVNAARTMLLHAARTEDRRIVMVTSALEGEGKTSLACHLATSLALTGRRTLLLDSDLRRPTTHRLFDIELHPGFCDYLRHECDLPDVVHPTSVDGLWLLPAGISDVQSLQALAFDETRAAFDWMRENFDFVVVDTSPVLPVADSLTICQHVDAVLFSILRDVSRMGKVHDAYTRLSELGAHILGAVVSGARSDSYSNSYSKTVVRGSIG